MDTRQTTKGTTSQGVHAPRQEDNTRHPPHMKLTRTPAEKGGGNERAAEKTSSREAEDRMTEGQRETDRQIRRGGESEGEVNGCPAAAETVDTRGECSTHQRRRGVATPYRREPSEEEPRDGGTCTHSADPTPWCSRRAAQRMVRERVHPTQANTRV